MGLFDGARGPGRCGKGSTADLAALTGWPVILVLDVSAQAETAAAIALGCRAYREDIRLAGVILNRVAGPGHADLIRPAMSASGSPSLAQCQGARTSSFPTGIWNSFRRANLPESRATSMRSARS